MSIPCIYKITNKINNKIYIGSTNNFSRRRRQHLFDLRRNKHANDHLQKSYNKYNENNFDIEIIEQCSIEFLLEREQYWIDTLGTANSDIGYNKNSIAGRTSFSKEIRLQIVATRRRNNPAWHSNDISQKIKNGLADLDLSQDEETKRKISTTMKKIATNRNPEVYKKMSATKKGKPILKCRKKVYCKELDRVFNSIQEAADTLKLQRTGISMVLNGTIKTTGGYTFERA